jgi:hypothetical protein
VRLAWIAFIAAGCLPSREFPIDAQPETESLLYLLVNRCEPGIPCVPIYVRSVGEPLPLNLALEDRVFVGEYPYAGAALGIPRDAFAVAAGTCPAARPFPEPTEVSRIDPGLGREDVEAFPPEWSLPAFEYAACFQSGGCLDFGEGDIPICKLACTAPEVETPAPPDLSQAPSDDWAVEECADGWFDLESRTCRTIDAPCDDRGWPLSPPPAAAYVATGTTSLFLGTRDEPYTSIDQAAADRPQVVLLHAGTPHLVRDPVSWSVRMIGCRRAPGLISTVGSDLTAAPALMVRGSTVTFAAESIAFANGIQVDAAQLVLHRSTIEISLGPAISPGIVLANGSVADLSDVRVQSSTNAAIDLIGGSRLEADRLHVLGPRGVRSFGSTVHLTDSSFRTIIDDPALLIRNSTVTLTRVAIDSVCQSAVQLSRSFGRLDEVRIARLGRHLTPAQDPLCDLSNGLRLFTDSEMIASRIRIAAPPRPGEDRVFEDAIVVKEGSKLRLTNSRVAQAHAGMRAADADIELEGVAFEGIEGTGFNLLRTVAELRSVSTSGGHPGIDVESSTVTGARIAVAADDGRAIEIERDEACAACFGSVVELSDVDVRVVEGGVVGTGLFLDVTAGRTQRFTRVRFTGFDPVVESVGGSLELEDATLETALAGTAFHLEGLRPQVLRLRDAIVIGGVGLDLVRPATIDAANTEFRGSDVVLRMTTCEWDLPHRVLQGVRVTDPLGPPILWP